MNRFLSGRKLTWALLALALALGAPLHAQVKDGAQRSAAGKAKPAAKPTTKRPAKPKAAKPAAPTARAAAAAAPAAAAEVPARPAPTLDADFIVAVVNTEPITNHEVRARMARAVRDMQESGVQPPPAAELRQATLERLITERAELQHARELGLSVSEEALKQAEMSIARQNRIDDLDELHRRIEADGIAIADFKNDLRNQVLLSELRAREIEPSIRVTEAEVADFIRHETGGQTAPPEINLGMILVAVPEDASAGEVQRLHARADEVAARARAGEDFAQLAKQYSGAIGQGADGGALGLRPARDYPELFVQNTQNLPVGGVAGPVQSGAGFHILKVLQRQANQQPAEVTIPQTQVRHILLTVGPQQNEQLARDRLADFKRRIESGKATFAELAREYSQDASAENGGELGWATPGQFVPEFEQAMNNLNPGQISDPVTTRFGVHLIEVEGRRDRVLTADEQRELARNVLREKKTREAFDTWSREVRGRAYVEYREPPA